MEQQPPPNPKFPEQDKNGIDLSLIRENLRLSPIERWRKARAAALNAMRMREAGRKAWERKLAAQIAP